jgi:hypothetical protein
MKYLFVGTKVGLALLFGASLVGLIVAIIKSEKTIAVSLLPFLAWTGVVLARPQSLPFFTHDPGALQFFRFAFLGLALFFICTVIWVMSVQLPRVLAKRYEGTVVALDATHPNAINYAYPIIRFVDDNGEPHEFSNFSPDYTPFRKNSKMPPVHIGDKILVIREGGRFFGLTRNETKVFWFLFLCTVAGFAFSASVSLISHARYESLQIVESGRTN